MVDQFPIYKTRADLERLLAEGLVESLRVEFKSSLALSTEGKKPDELCINVSAMANSAGGQILFCIDEAKKTNGPVRVDDGIVDPKVTLEWMEQTLISRVQPRMSGIRIDEIDLDQGRRGYVISIPQSLSGPHQAPDHRYYKRFQLSARAMEDYEVRDVTRRASTPRLEVHLALQAGKRGRVSYRAKEEVSEPFPLYISIENLSDVPALYTLLSIGLDAQLALRGATGVVAAGKAKEEDGTNLDWYQRKIAPPNDMPIFKEATLGRPDATFHLCVPGRDFHEYTMRVMVQTPGFSLMKNWTLQQMGFALELFDEHPTGRPSIVKSR